MKFVRLNASPVAYSSVSDFALTPFRVAAALYGAKVEAPNLPGNLEKSLLPGKAVGGRTRSPPPVLRSKMAGVGTEAVLSARADPCVPTKFAK